MAQSSDHVRVLLIGARTDRNGTGAQKSPMRNTGPGDGDNSILHPLGNAKPGGRQGRDTRPVDPWPWLDKQGERALASAYQAVRCIVDTDNMSRHNPEHVCLESCWF